MNVKEELWQSILATIWVHERSYPLSYKQTYAEEESKSGIEYKQYISDLRQKISNLNDDIKKMTINKDLIKDIYLPPRGGKINVTCEILNLITHHNDLISQLKKMEKTVKPDHF